MQLPSNPPNPENEPPSWRKLRKEILTEGTPQRLVAMCLPVVLLLLLIIGVILGAAITTWN